MIKKAFVSLGRNINSRWIDRGFLFQLAIYRFLFWNCEQNALYRRCKGFFFSWIVALNDVVAEIAFKVEWIRLLPRDIDEPISEWHPIKWSTEWVLFSSKFYACLLLVALFGTIVFLWQCDCRANIDYWSQ